MMKSEGGIVIKQTYDVKCLHCGFEGQANLGKAEVVTLDNNGAEWCPRCGTMALVGKGYVPGVRE